MNAAAKAAQAKKMAVREKLADVCDAGIKYFKECQDICYPCFKKQKDKSEKELRKRKTLYIKDKILSDTQGMDEREYSVYLMLNKGYYFLGANEQAEKTVVKNMKLAVKMFTKSAKGGYPDAMERLGFIYGKIFCPRDASDNKKEKAKEEKMQKLSYEWYKAGAEAGNVVCMKEVATCYKEGIGVMPSSSNVNYWLEKIEQVKSEEGNQ